MGVVLISVNHKLNMKQRQSFDLLFLLCCLLVPIFAQDCTVDQYKCEFGGKCIENDQICDGTEDCEDNLEDEFTCTVNGVPKCLGPRKYCDGIQDCDNNEDEDSQDCCKHSKLKFYNPSLVYLYMYIVRASRFLIFFLNFECIYVPSYLLQSYDYPGLVYLL